MAPWPAGSNLGEIGHHELPLHGAADGAPMGAQRQLDPPAGAEGVAAVVERLGRVQIDTIAVGSAHHHVI